MTDVAAETRLLVQHYVDMVRRHIVQDERLRILAQALYERHREALDFIFECRPEPLSLLTAVRDTIAGVEGLIEDSIGGNYLRFVPEIWDRELKRIKGDPAHWSKTGRGLLFEAKTYPNAPGRTNISLILGPGDPEMRKGVYDLASGQPALFTGLVKPMGRKWVTIFSRDLMTSAQAKNLTFEMQRNNVGLGWSDFQGSQLPALTSAILAFDAQLVG